MSRRSSSRKRIAQFAGTYMGRRHIYPHYDLRFGIHEKVGAGTPGSFYQGERSAPVQQAFRARMLGSNLHRASDRIFSYTGIADTERFHQRTRAYRVHAGQRLFFGQFYSFSQNKIGFG